MLYVAGVYLRDVTNTILFLSVLHLNMSRLSICCSCSLSHSWPQRWARVNRKEMILNCRKEMAVEGGVSRPRVLIGYLRSVTQISATHLLTEGCSAKWFCDYWWSSKALLRSRNEYRHFITLIWYPVFGLLCCSTQMQNCKLKLVRVKKQTNKQKTVFRAKVCSDRGNFFHSDLWSSDISDM